MQYINCCHSLCHYRGHAGFSFRLGFNFACLFGAAGCNSKVVVLGWITSSVNVLSFLVTGYMLRYSEGANYFTVAQVTNVLVVYLLISGW